jgi:Zn-dependent protease/predicted transcriptional regulator
MSSPPRPFRSSLLVGVVFGVEIRVHASFVLILAFGAIQWGTTYQARGALFGALLMLCLFLCVVLHELGHSLVAKAFGLPVREIILLPIGGVSRMEKNPEKPIHELVISIVGPIVNLVIAAVLFGIAGTGFSPAEKGALLKGTALPPSSRAAVVWLIGANVLLALFNMIPAFPMDGGRVLRALLALVIGPRRATAAATAIGQLIAIALGLLGVFTGNILLALVALFIFLGAGQEHMEERARVVLGTLKVGDAYNKYAITLAPGDLVSRVVDYLLTSYQPDFAVVQGGRLLGVVTRDSILKQLAGGTEDAYVAGMMDREPVRVQASQALDEVRHQLMEKGARLAAVFEGERFLGLVSLEDIAEALLVVSFQKAQQQRRAAMDARPD